MKQVEPDKHTGLGDISRKSEDVADYYDDWAAEYDTTLAAWEYKAPEKAASILADRLAPKAEILDAGCGTGLSGRALRSAGFTTIDGLDISARSLALAATTDAYRTLQAVDMQRLPLPLPDNRYDGLVCVGVMTYLTDSSGTLREFCRIVKPHGTVVVTQRSDLFIERNFDRELEQLGDAGMIEQLHISAPQPYLPDNEEFSDRILVRYISYTVR